MALQVWLPLNGNLNNRGLATFNTATQTSNPVYIDNGKIGKAMSTGSFYIPAASVSNFYNNTGMSFCFWIYPTTSESVSAIIGQSAMDAGDNRMYSIFQHPSGVDIHLSWQNENSSETFLSSAWRNVLTVNTWNHVAITYNGSTAKLYINGIYKNSTNGISERTNFNYNVPIPNSNSRYLNDIRIYDHCLSPKEVKEISRGLVLHYPLDESCIGINNPLLPPGVELYDYLAGNSYTWINTNYYVDLNKNLLITTESMKTVAGRSIILGNYNGNLNFNLEWNTTNLGRVYLNKDILLVTVGLNTKLILTINWDASTSTLSGTQNNNTFTVSESKSISNNPLRIFSDTRTNSSEFSTLVRIYRVSIAEEGILVRNFVPCTYWGVPGMWDTVENKFYGNQGTRQFTLGNKITLKEYEYLEKNSAAGTEDYINTGVSGFTMNNIRCECKVSINDTADSAFFGTRGNYYLFYNLEGNYFWPTSKAEKYYGTLQINTPYIVDWNRGYLTVKDESGTLFQEASRSNNTVQSYNLYIFNFNPLDSRTSQSKIYYFKIYINDLLIRDFIPVSYNGTPGLWDEVEWKFYGNAGTGSFTLGPEINLSGLPVWDSSGYGNNGTIIGNLTLNSDTPRYNYSTYFDGDTSGILIEDLNISNIINTALTYAFWIKPDGENGTRSVYFGSFSEASFSIEKKSNNKLRLWWNSNPDLTATLTIVDGQWQHIVITKNGTTEIKVYLNGVLIQTLTNTYNNVTFPTTYRIGRDIRTGPTSYKGLMSDFRIYSTVLSDNDIKELYNTSACLHNNGTLECYNFKEINNNINIKNTGIISCLNFYEETEYTPEFVKISGNGITLFTPSANANNSHSSDGYYVLFEDISIERKYVIELDFTWSGNWGFIEGLNSRVNFLGASRYKEPDVSYSWGVSNVITTALNYKMFPSYLINNSPAGGTYHYKTVFTIPANYASNDFCISTRTDYSDGNGSLSFGNLKIYLYENSLGIEKTRFKDIYITSKQFIEI